jgi:hypothetical protein
MLRHITAVIVIRPHAMLTSNEEQKKKKKRTKKEAPARRALAKYKIK